MIAGVLFNLVVMGVVFIALIFILSRVFAPMVNEQVGQILLVVSLLGSIAVSLFTYHRVVRYLQKKIDFGKYFIAFMGDGKK